MAAMLPRSQARTLLHTCARGLAKKAAPAAKGKANKSAAPSEAAPSVVPINYMKAGEDPPLKSLSEYPTWVPALSQVPASEAELMKKHASGVELSAGEFKRLFKLRRRNAIKQLNDELRK